MDKSLSIDIISEVGGGGGGLGPWPRYMLLSNILLWNSLLHECDHIRGKCAMAMVLFVGPSSLGTRQSLTIS